jgi:beta-aspartyl-peptidase (threonine type)
VLEDDPAFNAGVGSALAENGKVEMDASLMDGNNLRAGAVALLSGVRNPIHLARAVLDDGRHVFLAGAAAEAMARQQGLASCAPQDLITPQQRQLWLQRATGSAGTVGAVAVDRDGHTAAATSTGGMAGKLPGRIGDSAVIGAGTYADDCLGAASATGNGEAILRVTLARAVLDRLRDGGDPASAATAALAVLQQRTQATAGVIVVDPFGRLGHSHNTAHMTFGCMRVDFDSLQVNV